MNTNNISPDDPRLTLFALHEMEPAEQAEFAKLLQQDAAARRTVEEIRATAATLTAALEGEPSFAEASEGGPASHRFARLLRFPQLYFIVSGLAAACFAVIFFLQEEKKYESKQYREITLAEAAKDKAMRAQANEQKAKAAEGVIAMNGPAVLPAPSPVPMPMDVGSLSLNDRITLSGNSSPAAPMLRAASVKASGMEYTAFGFSRGRDFNTEAYGYRKDNAYLRVADQPLSTFSVDVDTASYANVRRFLLQGQRPPADAVRIEELVNYFPYSDRPPTGDVPFAASLEVASAPWAPEHRLVRIGIKGRELSEAARPAANLVFLLDVSGSMDEPNKLPLVKQSLRLLVDKLRPDDHVAIAVYAGASGLALPSTPAAHKAEIMEAIERLDAGGSTNGAMGIQLAYDIAKANFIPGGVNRVILATDGDFNVGVTSEGELVRLVEEKAKSGVFLTVLGFGMGNIKDSTLEQLADKGNGNYAYIDSLAEAKKTLVEQAGGTLVTIAKDVKLQVEFNPTLVQAYRLIGYENRLLAREDFNNDKVDAGEIGSGHTVTALYEVVPVGAELPEAGSVDPLKYQKVEKQKSKIENPKSDELLTVKIRYKEPTGDVSSKLEFTLHDTGAAFASASQDFKFAAAVAAFGMVLRDSPDKGAATLTDVIAWGRAGLGSDAGGYRSEFLGLVARAQTLLQ